MTCYFPLHAYRGKSKDADKIAITFRRSDSWRGVQLDLPCGQCIGCRLERSRQWAVRCMHEASLYEENSFLTLTYDDDHLPPDGSLVCPRDIDGVHYPGDFQLFMKRLRRSLGKKKVRYFHCGEYGERFGRPHYHALLFNHDFSDKVRFGGRDGKYPTFTSPSLSELWPKGFSVIGQVTFESAAYVARYVMKKVTGDRAESHYEGRHPEYTSMSRRPGIGKGWYEKFKADVYPLDRVVVRGVNTRPPRFYDNLLAVEDRSTFELLKIDREKNGQHFVEDFVDGRKIIVSDSSSARLAVKEVVKRAEISTLVRPLE